ncbi:MAG: hypothetical protein IPL26_29285 [Leptospiraceae bacterium]|nr:hypothetical protein [Leptospiraceae bacterium]
MKINIKLIIICLIVSINTMIFAEEESSSSPNQSQSGLVIKGGLWGLGGKATTELENRYFTDDLLSGFGFGQYNTAWSSPNRFYLLNPIGIDYYKTGIGPGSLLFGAEMRGFPGLGFTGYTPQYDFISVSRGTVGIHTADLKLKNLDLNLGYQMAFGNFLVTPKFQLRNFSTDLKESATYLSGGSFGIRESYYRNNTWAGFIGVNLLFNINEASSVYFEFAMDSPILGQIYSTGDFNKTSFTVGNTTSGSTTLLKKSYQEIRGTVIDLGYQHSFGALGLRIGYRSEELKTIYPAYTDVPVTFNSNGNLGIGVDETILNSIFYGNTATTTLQSLYITATYKL